MRLVWAILLVLAGSANADTPLALPADYTTTVQSATLTASVAGGFTRIIRTDGSLDWSIPRWIRFAYLSPDGRALLALADSGNLVGTVDPDQIVLTLYRATDPDPLEATLSALMNPADMPQTTSHYAWLQSISWESDGWTLELTDGQRLSVDPVSGVFTRL